MGDGTKYPGSAEPALQGVMSGECALHLVERPGLGEALHGDDVRTVCLGRVLGAAAHCASIDQDRTGSADAVLTADMNPESLEFMTQEIADSMRGSAWPDRRCPFSVNSSVNRFPAARCSVVIADGSFAAEPYLAHC